MQYSNFFTNHSIVQTPKTYIPGARRGFWILPAEQNANQFDVQSGCNPAHRVTDMREWSDFRTLSMMPCFFFFPFLGARARASTPTRRIPKKIHFDGLKNKTVRADGEGFTVSRFLRSVTTLTVQYGGI
jgi:hypothetical protein